MKIEHEILEDSFSFVYLDNVKNTKKSRKKSIIREVTPHCNPHGPHKFAIRSMRGFWKDNNPEMKNDNFVPSASKKRSVRPEIELF